MSANNQVVIYKSLCEKEPAFIIKDVDVDSGGGYDIGIEDTLEKAIKKANEYILENEVEYGLSIKI